MKKNFAFSVVALFVLVAPAAARDVQVQISYGVPNRPIEIPETQTEAEQKNAHRERLRQALDGLPPAEQATAKPAPVQPQWHWKAKVGRVTYGE